MTLRSLIAHRDPDVLGLASALLRAHGFAVVGHATSWSAAELLAREHAPIDLAVVALRLEPGRDIYDCAIRLAVHGVACFVVLAEPSDPLWRARLIDPVGIVERPLEPGRLDDAIQRARVRAGDRAGSGDGEASSTSS